MTRTMLTAVLLAAAIGASAADKHVDLNAPGALEKLQASNPVHYRKVQEILKGLEERRGRDVVGWLQASFAAKQISYYDLYRTSYPPQRDLSFVLDETRYSARFFVPVAPVRMR